ncbi:DUF72 domain-containing protein [Thermoproteus tenax]|uniref:DUF72 domain-containing protein n=1 Tax=Thermoproteus tenax (strain ATCC 35583 / DSM 2078 / JCM 9277 / NBRC 100435 / Kra 1) TaxID=768679 RepID=G4RMD3_THETK|nr:DUF72 domain-containing protein [Thermoproteus tenax]CCC80764.1 conserved hypothetical protein [Thermoproteus tenax Kra 1]
MTEVFVGTSGWLYDWNPDSLDWYVESSGLNAVELNATFYRYPFRSQVASWARRGSRLRWSVKVHRYITHTKRLKEDALGAWARFKELMAQLDPYVDFYLVQLPPAFDKRDRHVERLRSFAESTGLGRRLAVEFRHASWFNEDTVKLCEELGITAVSVDEPGYTWIVATGDIVYLRLHGRTSWYAHEYSEEELRELADAVLSLRPKRVYAFFNNDHWMLENARAMMRLFSKR